MPNRKTTNIVLNRVRTIGKYPLIFDILCNQKFVRIYHMKPGEGVFAGSKLSNGETVLGAFTPFVNLIELAPKSIYYSVKSFNGYSSEKIKQEHHNVMLHEFGHAWDSNFFPRYDVHERKLTHEFCWHKWALQYGKKMHEGIKFTSAGEFFAETFAYWQAGKEIPSEVEKKFNLLYERFKNYYV